MVESKLQDLLDSPEFEAVLDKKLESLGSSPMGMMLSMMSLNAAKIKPFIKVGENVESRTPIFIRLHVQGTRCALLTRPRLNRNPRLFGRTSRDSLSGFQTVLDIFCRYNVYF